MTCIDGHARVVASGACATCGLPLQLTGYIPLRGAGPDWLAPPFAGPAAARCRTTGGPHVVVHGLGTCCGCSARLEPVGTTDGQTWWFEDIEDRTSLDVEGHEVVGEFVYPLQGPTSARTVRAAGRFVAELSEADRFWLRVTPDRDGCWLWAGHRDADGYGQFKRTVSPGQYRTVRAHRWAYEAAWGPIPAGLTLDHLCGRPACVRPQHLEAVTNAENLRRRHARRRTQRHEDQT